MGLTSLRKIFLAFVSVFVAGCATDVQKSGFPQISVAHLQPIILNVARVEVVNECFRFAPQRGT